MAFCRCSHRQNPKQAEKNVLGELVDQFLVDTRFQVEPLLADDPAGGRGVGVVHLEVDLGHLVEGVPFVAEAEHPVPVGAGDAAHDVATHAVLFVVVADGRQQEAGMAGDLLVVAKLDDEIAVAVAEEVEVAILQERLDHAVAEALDETHAPVSRRANA